MRLLYLLVMLCCCSCLRAPDNIDRAARLAGKIYAKHPSLLKSDTVTVTDTIKLPGITRDSLVSYTKSDTITLYDTITRVRVRVKVDTNRRTVYIRVDQQPREILKTKTIRETRLVKQKGYSFSWWWLGLIPLLLAAYVLYRIRKRLN